MRIKTVKTEKQKMIDGELYNAIDPELSQDRLNARRLTRLFNQALESDFDGRPGSKRFRTPQAGKGRQPRRRFYTINR